MAVHKIDLRKGQIPGSPDPYFSDPLTKTSATALHALGATRWERAEDVVAGNADHFGDRLWVYVKNDEGSALAAGQIVVAGSGAAGTRGYKLFNVVIAEGLEHLERVAGVVAHAIPTDEYGWIIRQGYCEIQGDGNVTAGSPVASGASGRAVLVVFDDAAATDTGEFYLALATEADAAAGTLFTAILHRLG